MSSIDALSRGWDFMSQVIGSDLSSRMAVSDYVANVNQNDLIRTDNHRIQLINEEIDKMMRDVNEHPYVHQGVEQFKGYVAEEVHAHSYNIDAISKDSSHRAWTLHENSSGSIHAR